LLVSVEIFSACDHFAHTTSVASQPKRKSRVGNTKAACGLYTLEHSDDRRCTDLTLKFLENTFINLDFRGGLCTCTFQMHLSY
jgi:hypothetical protein